MNSVEIQKKIQDWMEQGECSLVLSSASVEETLETARLFGACLKPGTAVGLRGPLGSGKTVFVKGVAIGLGLEHAEEVKSPTFVLMHIYEARIPVYHFDLYRLEGRADLEAVGLEHFLTDSRAVTLVEWSEKAGHCMQKRALEVELRTQGENERTLVFNKSLPRDLK